ncbi:hypothetical protein EZV62_001535 [Acer yangbiense]|uniref:MLO-like protein n=1 Tax=Acer yangbiense TaxID=1000413 RepID=A0A5C7IWS8_9ROSI|nr:hypothetical protein EZV62_001535 [Acer yangbiense]
MAGEGTTLEYTPTWVVALVCSVIVIISLAVLKKNDQKPLFEALQKIKEELMLLGFISLLLTVFQNSIAKFCISEDLASKWLPCKRDKSPNTITTTHFDRLLAESSASADYCTANGKVPLLSLTALHHLHIFIFVLAVVHVTFCALTILFGGAKIRKWKRWEDSASKGEYDLQEGQSSRYTHVQDHDFIKHRFQGLGKSYSLLGWLHSFFKQFYGSVTKSDYTTLRLGFIMLVSLVVRLPVLVAECLWLAYIFLDSIHSLRFKFDCEFASSRVFIQFLCSYSTLPLYAIVTQMGTSFKKAIFDEHIQDGLVGWARLAKRNKTKNAANGSSHKQDSSAVIQLVKVAEKQSEIEEEK